MRGEEIKTPALAGGLAGNAAVPATPPAAREYGQAVGGASPLASPAPGPPARATAPLGSLRSAPQEKQKLASDLLAQSGSTQQLADLSLAASLPAPGSAADTSALAVSANTFNDANQLSLVQGFVQTAPATKPNDTSKVSPNRPVLVSFRLEQTAQQVRVVDGDGSVYTGSLQPTGSFYRSPSVSAETPALAKALTAPKAKVESVAPAAGPASEPLAPIYFSFRVAGTNRGLNQKVVFAGNLFSVTNPASVTDAFTTRGGVNSRIAGTVWIGNGQPIEINALPAK